MCFQSVIPLICRMEIQYPDPAADCRSLYNHCVNASQKHKKGWINTLLLPFILGLISVHRHKDHMETYMCHKHHVYLLCCICCLWKTPAFQNSSAAIDLINKSEAVITIAQTLHSGCTEGESELSCMKSHTLWHCNRCNPARSKVRKMSIKLSQCTHPHAHRERVESYEEL